jgi:methyl-accepting chemotaxis protein
MKKSLIKNKLAGIGSMSIKQRFLLFSVVLFIVILAGGSTAFFFSMRQIVQESKSGELAQVVELKRVNLEASVNGEIAIALKMAGSPLIKRHFLDPADDELRQIAFEEIAGYQDAFASKTVFWASDVDKEFYFDEGNHYTLDIDDPDTYWYKMTLYETTLFNFNINYNDEMQRVLLFINAPVFDSAHTPIGLVGTGIDLTEFVDSIYRDYTSGDPLYFFNDLGELTGAKDAHLIADKVTLDKQLGETGQEILAWADNNQTDTIYTFISRGGIVAVGPIPTLGWYVVVIHPLALTDYFDTSMTGIFVAMMGLIVIIFVIFNVSTRTFLRPLAGMIEVLNQISKDWDLRNRIDIRNRDEIGNLAEFFNQTFEKFRVLLSGIKGRTVTLSTTGDELSLNMDETNYAISDIDAAIQDMRKQVLNQVDAINDTARSMEKITAGLNDLNEHINVQVESVEHSSSAIEELLASIKSVTETLVRNTGNINSLAASSGAGREDMQKVSTDIEEIAKESEGLLQINLVMQTISSQTNLLAMNAAIEAAHAGDSGSGFMVVAEEIRKLAENSAKQSKTISAVLKKIKSSIDLITKSTAVVMERFGTIEQEVETVSNQETQIRNAMEEQGVGSRNILDAVTRLNDVTGLVKSASENMTTESKEVQKHSGNLKGVTAEVAGRMDEMAGSADKIVSTVGRSKEISAENKRHIDELSVEIAKFKVDG